MKWRSIKIMKNSFLLGAVSILTMVNLPTAVLARDPGTFVIGSFDFVETSEPLPLMGRAIFGFSKLSGGGSIRFGGTPTFFLANAFKDTDTGFIGFTIIGPPNGNFAGVIDNDGAGSAPALFNFTASGISALHVQRRPHIPPGVGDRNNPDLGSATFDGVDNLSFSDIVVDTVLLNDGSVSIGDPIEGGNFLVGDTSLIGPIDDEGWLFDETTFQIEVGGETVFTADLVNNFLFVGGGEEHPGSDSEFQGEFDNIVINNTINSTFLDNFSDFIDAGGRSHFSFASNLLSTTNNLTIAGSSEGETWVDGTGTAVPETTSPISLLVLSTLGAGSALLRNKKQNKSAKVSEIKV